MSNLKETLQYHKYVKPESIKKWKRDYLIKQVVENVHPIPDKKDIDLSDEKMDEVDSEMIARYRLSISEMSEIETIMLLKDSADIFEETKEMLTEILEKMREDNEQTTNDLHYIKHATHK